MQIEELLKEASNEKVKWCVCKQPRLHNKVCKQCNTPIETPSEVEK